MLYILYIYTIYIHTYIHTYIYMGINFRECYQIKYFAVPTFANLPKNRETLIRESFIL